MLACGLHEALPSSHRWIPKNLHHNGFGQPPLPLYTSCAWSLLFELLHQPEKNGLAGDMNRSDLRPLKLPHEKTPGHAREHCYKPLQSIVAVAAEMHSLLKTERARKFMTVAIFTINLRQMFRHLDATLPKYELRAFGCQVPVGWIYSINPIMIISLVPVVSSLTTSVNHFDMIHAGSYIAALSPFLMVASQSVSAVILFVISLSLGEAAWSPR